MTKKSLTSKNFSRLVITLHVRDSFFLNELFARFIFPFLPLTLERKKKKVECVYVECVKNSNKKEWLVD